MRPERRAAGQVRGTFGEGRPFLLGSWTGPAPVGSGGPNVTDSRGLHARASPDVGDQAHLRVSRRWDRRPRGGSGAHRGHRIRSGPARGERGLHGMRPCQMDRRSRLLPRDLGTGRDPPAERALRREARSPAGDRDRRPAGPRRAWRQLPAGGRPHHAVQGRGGRVHPPDGDADAGAPSRRPGGADRAGPPKRHLPRRPERRAGIQGGDQAAARARHRPQRRRLFGARDAATRARSAPRGRSAERRRESRHPDRGRRDERR